MKTFYLLLALALAGPAHAALNCYTDSFGNTQCFGDNGYNSQTYTDSFGNSQTYDNKGNSFNCYTDSFNNTTCY